jgi:hypothetical protein
MSAEFAVQQALYTALSGLGLTVYDSPRQIADSGGAADYPNVSIGEIVFAPWDDKGVNGFDFVARIHTRSRSGSMKQAKDIQGQMYGALHHGTLSIAGYSLTLLRRELSDVTRVSDGSFHGVCEYRGLIQAD